MIIQVSDKIIDLQLGATLVGKDTIFAREMVEILVNGFPSELKKLEMAYAKQDWATIKDVVHRVKGGVSYCGAPRLQKISTTLLDYLHSNKTDDREKLYQEFISEIHAVEHAYKSL